MKKPYYKWTPPRAVPSKFFDISFIFIFIFFFLDFDKFLRSRAETSRKEYIFTINNFLC